MQEALTNVRRHAGSGASARVCASIDKDDVHIEVADDGPGREPAQAAGHGLLGMRERVALYHGDFQAGAGEGGGFRVRARLPIGRRGR